MGAMATMMLDCTYAQIGKAIKAFLTADRIDYPQEDREIMVNKLLERYDISLDSLNGERLLHQANAWWQFLNNRFQNHSGYRKFPIHHLHGGRSFSTIVDLVLEKSDGIILIQNSGFKAEGRSLETKAIELAPWLYLTKTALQIIFKSVSVRTFVHFVMSGKLVELEVSGDGS